MDTRPIFYNQMHNRWKIYFERAISIYLTIKDEKLDNMDNNEKKFYSLMFATHFLNPKFFEGTDYQNNMDYITKKIKKSLQEYSQNVTKIELTVGYEEINQTLKEYRNKAKELFLINDEKMRKIYEKEVGMSTLDFEYYFNEIFLKKGISNDFFKNFDFTQEFNKNFWIFYYGSLSIKCISDYKQKMVEVQHEQKQEQQKTVEVQHEQKQEQQKTVEVQHEQKQEQQKIDNLNLSEILNGIKKKFIGQEQACEDLFLNIVCNVKQGNIAIDSGVPSSSTIFLDGPTGTGKTAIVREITENLGIPFVAVSAMEYSAPGYKGGELTDIFISLIKKAGNLEAAQHGIVVLDEFDKLASNSDNSLAMRKAVQQQLLHILSGGEIQLMYEDEKKNNKSVNFDTSNITFVCLGALTDLRKMKKSSRVVRKIGFESDFDNIPKSEDYTISQEDLIKIGFERELVGRMQIVLHTEDYSKEVLRKILLESTISPLKALKLLVENWNKEIIFDDEEKVYDLIAEKAYNLHLGVRGLQTVIGTIRTALLKKIILESNKEIFLTWDEIKLILDNSEKRKNI